MIYRRGLDCESFGSATIACRRDGNPVVQINLLVFLTQTSVYTLGRALRGRRILWADFIKDLSMLNKALHLLIMDFFLHLLKVLVVRLLACFARSSDPTTLLTHRMSLFEARDLGCCNSSPRSTGIGEISLPCGRCRCSDLG